MLERLVAAQIAPRLVLVENRTGDGINELGGEVQLFFHRVLGLAAVGIVDHHADDRRPAGKLGTDAENLDLYTAAIFA